MANSSILELRSEFDDILGELKTAAEKMATVPDIVGGARHKHRCEKYACDRQCDCDYCKSLRGTKTAMPRIIGSDPLAGMDNLMSPQWPIQEVGADPYVGVQTAQGVTEQQQLGFNALPPPITQQWDAPPPPDPP